MVLNSFRWALVTTLGALLLTAVIAWPVLGAPSERVYGTPIAGRHHDPATVMRQFAGQQIPAPYVQPATDWLGRALARAMSPVSPVAAYNVVILSTFPLAALFAFLLAFDVTRSRGASAFAALAFAFSPFHVAHAAYHPHVAQVQWIALAFFALWRAVHGFSPARGGALVLAVSLAALSNWYAGLILAVLFGVAAPAFWLTPTPEAHTRARRDLLWTAAILLVAAVVAIVGAVVFAPMILERAADFAVSRDDLFRYTARWRDYLWPPTDPRDPGIVERQVALGVGLLSLAGAAGVAWLRSPRDPATRAVPGLIAIAAAAFLCSLPPEGTVFGLPLAGPTAALHAIAPMFRSYARFAVVVQLMAALVAAIGLSVLWKRGRVARTAATALVALTIVEYAPWPPRSYDVLPTSAHRWLTRQPNAAAFRVFECRESSLADVNTSWLMGMPLEHSRTKSDCSEPQIADRLRAHGTTHVIVGANLPASRRFQIGRSAGLTEVHRADDGSVFAVTTPMPELVLTIVDGGYPRESDANRTWVWSAGTASFEVENLTGAPLTRTWEVELGAFAEPRHVTIDVNGTRVTTLLIDRGDRIYHINGLAFHVGSNRIELRTLEPPGEPATLGLGDDRRALAFSVGRWRWLRE